MQKKKSVKMNYSNQLDDPRWKRKRTIILRRDGCKCTKCSSSKNLNVHHMYYIKDTNAWNYPNKALITFCQICHEKWHNQHEIEVRNKGWNKNKKYQAPLKYSNKKIKKLVIIEKPETKEQRFKNKLLIKLNNLKLKKVEYLQSIGVENWEDIIEQTKNFTLKQLKNYIEFKVKQTNV